jgi:hypothetical protein
VPGPDGSIRGFTPTRKTAEAWERIFGKREDALPKGAFPIPGRPGCATPPGSPCYCTGRCRREER